MEILKVHDLCKTYGKGEAEVEGGRLFYGRRCQRGTAAHRLFWGLAPKSANKKSIGK